MLDPGTETDDGVDAMGISKMLGDCNNAGGVGVSFDEDGIVLFLF